MVPTNPRGPVPVWMNGYLIRPQSQTVSGESNIPLYDAKGNLERPRHTPMKPGTFWKLWGADGKTLVVNMAKSGDLAWVKIVN